jgi:hypothetical protein
MDCFDWRMIWRMINIDHAAKSCLKHHKILPAALTQTGRGQLKVAEHKGNRKPCSNTQKRKATKRLQHLAISSLSIIIVGALNKSQRI